MITRSQALELWREHNDDDALYKHALAVEAIMRYYAKKYNEDEEKWGVTGLLHDVDYQRYPEQHCEKATEILTDAGVDEDIIRAMQSHGYTIRTDVEPKTLMEKTLFTIDEISGFLVACTLVRPSKSLDDLELKSVKKKWKDARFAAGVDRNLVQSGAEMLGMELDEIIKECIIAMRPIGKELGLNVL